MRACMPASKFAILPTCSLGATSDSGYNRDSLKERNEMLIGIEENLGFAVNPESCREVGKECRECISSSASVVALLCPTLDAAAAQQTFFRMYRHQGCGFMARSFVREYLDVVEPNYFETVTTPAIYAIAACA